ncbi:MarR family winged helix-turn-helix transcriptional regulator [Niallia sp. Krafla_26]|uniref:MarR family winged helix-turn-helix transcriptional regulator n=1 Tax=Niallia sp. Krafla_26 TaxID=3064703 RepID=UPI003D17DC79
MELSFFHHQLQFSRSFTKKLNEQLSEIGLYQSQWLIVYYLKHYGSSTLVGISRYLNVEKPTISRTVDRLEKSQLVERIPSNDKRERIIRLTEKGNEVYEKAIQIIEVFEQSLIEGIPDSEKEIALKTIMILKGKLQ